MMTTENTKEATWRCSKADFLRKVDEFIKSEFPKIQEFYKTLKCLDKGIGKELTSIFAKLRSDEPFTKDQIRNLKLQAIMKDSKTYWSEWSREYHEPEELIFRILINNYFNEVSSICYSYMCMVENQLNEKLIEDIIFLNSDLFDFNYWDDFHVDIVTKIIIKGNKYNCVNDLKALLKSDNIRFNASPKLRTNISKLLDDCYSKKYTPKIILKEKLDWYNIDNYQNLSNSFKIKYKDLIKKSYELTDEDD